MIGAENVSDLPSFSRSRESQDGNFSIDYDFETARRFNEENPDLMATMRLLACNRVYMETLDQLVANVDAKLQQNRELQSIVKNRVGGSNQQSGSGGSVRGSRNTFSIACWPPYFKDSSGMVPSLNVEAREISQICLADPLMEEEKKWNSKELILLKESVAKSLKYNKTISLESRKDLLKEKIRSAGIETTDEQKEKWRDEIDQLKKRINYIMSRPVDEVLLETTDYSEVDWAKISSSDFHGSRSIVQLRQKWCNDICPHFNQEPWSVEEDEKMLELANDFTNWSTIAELLHTGRTAFRCFQRFTYIRQSDREPRIWTPEEDQTLLRLINMHKVGDEIPWARVAAYMDGRTKLSCEYRYTRSLCEKLRHGRWTEAEDLLLLEAVNKYGPQNWNKIADYVSGRSSLQCRDRWVHVLDQKRRDKPWTWEEIQRLLYGVHLFGRSECAKIAKLIPGRNNMDVRMKIRLLVKYKIEQDLINSGAAATSNKKVKPVFRYFAGNYMFCKMRRRQVIDEFNKLVEKEQNDRKNQLVARLGLGSYVSMPEVGFNLNYSNVKIERQKEFGNWKVFGSGRWVKMLQKNPNEYDRRDLMIELDNLSVERREEALEWIRTSDERLFAEYASEKDIPDDPTKARDFYDAMYTQERRNQLFEQLSTLLEPRQNELIYYERHKKRPPKIRLKTIVVPKQKKKKRRKKPSKLAKLLSTMDQLDSTKLAGLRYADRMMIELYKEIEEMSPRKQRIYLLKKLVKVIRDRVHMSNLKLYKDEQFREKAFYAMYNYVRDVVEEPMAPIPMKPPIVCKKEETVVLPSNWKSMTMKDMIRLKISPDLLSLLAEKARGDSGAAVDEQAAARQQQEQQQQQTLDELANQRKRRRTRSWDKAMQLELVQQSNLKTTAIVQNLPSKASLSSASQAFPSSSFGRGKKRPRTAVVKVEQQASAAAIADVHIVMQQEGQLAAATVTSWPLHQIVNKVLPPCMATINAVDIYEKKIRNRLLWSVPDDTDPDQPGTSQSSGGGNGLMKIPEEIRHTQEYNLLKRRMYRLFFLPMAMIHSSKLVVAEMEEGREKGGNDGGNNCAD